MIYTDTHCHLDFDSFDADRDAVLARAIESGLAFLVNPAVDLGSARAAIALSASHPGRVYAACGFHPHYATQFDNTGALQALEYLAQEPGVVALGEIGLDYYRDLAPRPLQREVFASQLELAAKLNLPVIIHNREADADVEAMLLDWVKALPQGSPLRQNPGSLHAFSGSLAMAESLAAFGFCFGVGGPITYRNAGLQRQISAALPLTQVLTETDAPYLTPHPLRGKRNEPAYVPLVLETLAQLHQKGADLIGAITTANARRVFRIGLD